MINEETVQNNKHQNLENILDPVVHTNDENEISSKFFHLYKCSGVLTNQEERREKLLRDLKKRRTQAVDEKRKITDLFEDESQETVLDEMEVEEQHIAKKKKHLKPFYNRLMLSEWFKDIPQDLEQNWLVKLCPKGHRNLVVASQNVTVAYNRAGMEKAVFESYLPGGGAKPTNSHVFTVLDCIYSRTDNCYYVLDVLAWNSLSVKRCDTDFRFFWLKSKVEELEKSSLNEHTFVYVDSFPAELPIIEELLSKSYVTQNGLMKLDGILFYHRETFYTSGITPLVGWLKPYMIPEMLHIPVHEDYMLKKPNNYTSLHDYLTRVKKKQKQSEDVNEMETGCIDNTDD